MLKNDEAKAKLPLSFQSVRQLAVGKLKRTAIMLK